MTGLKESKGSPFSSRKLRNLEEVEEHKLVDDVSRNTKSSSSTDEASLKEPPAAVVAATALSPPLLLATDGETPCQKTTTTTTTTTTKARVVSTSAAACTEESSWPCANCHAMVSEERCPHCRGIQVKINKENRGNSMSSKITKPELWIERLSPATVLRKSPRPASPAQQGLLKSDNDDKLIEIEDAEEELDASSTSVANHEIEDEEDGSTRPIDPVAYTLASAPSPFPAASGATTASSSASSAAAAVGVPAIVLPLKRRGSSGTASGLESGEPKKQRIESAT